jgi:hypothetical protein
MAFLAFALKGDFEMLKKRIIAVITAIALTVAAVGGAAVVADSLGLPVTPQVQACNSPNGGGC